MAIHYEIEDRQGYIYLKGEGMEGGVEEDLEIHQFIVDVCKARNCPHVLIDDSNVTYTASLLSIYQLAKHYSQIDRFITQAAVVSNPQYRLENQFFEDTMRNRNINLRVFYDLKEAETWLTT